MLKSESPGTHDMKAGPEGFLAAVHIAHLQYLIIGQLSVDQVVVYNAVHREADVFIGFFIVWDSDICNCSE
eukprot:1159765-Pelagomonas_calceolata.AAC.12